MRTLTHHPVKPAARRAVTVALAVLAAGIATAPSAMATESAGVLPSTVQTLEDAEKETRAAVSDLLGPLGHTWGN
ncbi:hypothetical protein [Streptomyces sp. enrichment culture]|uniref:hypothetical protein n=1 Tax=Streptomyces sp. enrichment culture TaxID=1795815 RepID=UPI003F54A498